MNPIIFLTLPEFFSFIAVIFLVQACGVLLATGRRYLKEASLVPVGIAGAVIGEGVALRLFPGGTWVAALAGLAMGLSLGYKLRPVGVGMTLAFLGFYGASYIVNVADVQYMAAIVLFVYGFLLTDLAPSFVSCLLASAIMFLAGIWMGFQVPLMLTLVTAVAAARLLVAVGPSRFVGKVQASIRAFVA